MKKEEKEEKEEYSLSPGVKKVILLLREKNIRQERFIKKALIANTVWGQVRILIALVKFKFTKKF